MATTIQLSERTLKLLKRLKGAMQLKSYDAVIQRLVTNKEQIPDSLFGAHPEMKPWNHETDRMRFRHEDD